MTPVAQGRICSSCNKSVVDFTSWPDEDIIRYLQKHSKERVCGRFNHAQLQSIIIHIPKQQLFHVSPAKTLLMAIFIAFGTTLFSCVDNNGNNRKIEKIEIVDETESATVGMPVPPPLGGIDLTVYNTLGDVALPDDVTFSHNGTSDPNVECDNMLMGKPQLSTSHFTSDTTVEIMEVTSGVVISGEVALTYEDEDNIYDFADEMPEFPGGHDSMMNFIRRAFRFPLNQQDVTGRLFVSLIVKSNGLLEEIEVKRAPTEAISESVKKIFQTMPAWKPGKVQGKAVNVRMTIPIRLDRM